MFLKLVHLIENISTFMKIVLLFNSLTVIQNNNENLGEIILILYEHSISKNKCFEDIVSIFFGCCVRLNFSHK